MLNAIAITAPNPIAQTSPRHAAIAVLKVALMIVARFSKAAKKTRLGDGSNAGGRFWNLTIAAQMNKTPTATKATNVILVRISRAAEFGAPSFDFGEGE